MKDFFILYILLFLPLEIIYQRKHDEALQYKVYLQNIFFLFFYIATTEFWLNLLQAYPIFVGVGLISSYLQSAGLASRVIIYLIIFEFVNYFLHRLFHKSFPGDIDFLIRFHFFGAFIGFIIQRGLLNPLEFFEWTSTPCQFTSYCFSSSDKL